MFLLACTFLITKQYISIQNIYISPTLSSIGYNHTWLISLRFIDHKYCRLQIRHLEPEKLIRKLQQNQLLLMKPDTSNIITTILAWCQHVSGISFPILEKHPNNIMPTKTFSRLQGLHTIDASLDK